MLSTGCDLHKQTITICVVNQMRIVILRRTLACADEEALRRFFEELRQRRVAGVDQREPGRPAGAPSRMVSERGIAACWGQVADACTS